MANAKFDINSIVKTVKGAINPESSIPGTEESNPVAYRVARLKELVKKSKEDQQKVAKQFANIETNLNEVIIELNKIAEEHGLKEDKAEESKKDEAKEEEKKDEEVKEEEKKDEDEKK